MRLYLKKELEELEKLIKLAGEGGVADNSGEETREVRAREAVEVWSLERYELEKQKEWLVILMEKLERYELEKQK